VNLEIWSDVACPWCFVGKRRIEAALSAFGHADDVVVRWRSFELDPSAPRERDVDGATHLAQKYGMTRERAQEAQQRVAVLGAGDGIDFRFDIARGGNTFDAHRLLALAADRGVQDALKERLMLAYHCEGEPIGDPATLARLAIDVGLSPEDVHGVLDSDRFATEVREDERTASALGIDAVPCFVVDRAIAASGAQSPEVLRQLLDRAWSLTAEHATAGPS
jgi:predicted DsbA family dithiol-disulfide isomerase